MGNSKRKGKSKVTKAVSAPVAVSAADDALSNPLIAAAAAHMDLIVKPPSNPPQNVRNGENGAGDGKVPTATPKGPAMSSSRSTLSAALPRVPPSRMVFSGNTRIGGLFARHRLSREAAESQHNVFNLRVG